jgi:hypothetical protein
MYLGTNNRTVTRQVDAGKGGQEAEEMQNMIL